MLSFAADAPGARNRARSQRALLPIVLGLAIPAVASATPSSWERSWSTGCCGNVRDLASDDELVYVATGGGLFDVRAVRPVGGEDVWIAAPPVLGGTGDAHAISVLGRRLFAGGTSGEPGSWPDWTVAAFDAADGTPLWIDRFDWRGLGEGVNDLAAADHRVFAVGQVLSSIRFGGEYLVRAYRALDGRLLWQDLVARGGNDAAQYVVTNGDTVWVVGTVSPTGLGDVFVRAYEAATGARLWTRSLDVEDDRPSGVALLGNRLGVAWNAGSAWRVTAFDAASGRRIWEDADTTYPLAGGAFNAAGIVGARRRFVVSGAYFDGPDGYGMLTRCYAADDGNLLWEERDLPPQGSSFPRGVTRRRSEAIVAAEQHSNNATDGSSIRVRSFDMLSGAVLWEYGYDVPNADEWPQTVHRVRRRLLVGGASHPWALDSSHALLLGYRIPQ